MFNSFTNWLNTLPVPKMGASNESDAKEGEGEATANAEEVITHQDSAVETSEQLEAKVTADGAAVEQPPQESSLLNNEAVEKIQLEAQAALESAKEFGNKLFSFGMTNLSSATKQLQEKAVQLKDVIEKNSIIGDFNKEHEKFVTEKKIQQQREEVASPPWVGYVEEEKLKKQILALSTDPRNFLRSPPNGVEFQFDFNIAHPIALATLEEDPNLKEMRFRLVPSKIKERQFWRNYFYRVSLIKQSTQLTALASERDSTTSSAIGVVAQEANTASTPTATKKDDGLDVHQNEPTSTLAEFASDQYEDNINEEEIKRDMRQLKLDKELEEAEWDKELQDDIDNITTEELEKEISEMIDSEN